MNLLKGKFLALGNPEPSLVICVDFNLPGVNWGTNVQDHTNSRTRCMTSLMEELFLTQIVNVQTSGQNTRPVFCQTNMSDRLLVLIDTSREDMDACSKSNCTDLDGLSFFMKT